MGLLSAAFSNVLVGRMTIDTIDTLFWNRATSVSFDLARITFIVPVAVPAVMSYAGITIYKSRVLKLAVRKCSVQILA